jgi:hypothetical protein
LLQQKRLYLLRKERSINYEQIAIISYFNFFYSNVNVGLNDFFKKKGRERKRKKETNIKRAIERKKERGPEREIEREIERAYFGNIFSASQFVLVNGKSFSIYKKPLAYREFHRNVNAANL